MAGLLHLPLAGYPGARCERCGRPWPCPSQIADAQDAAAELARYFQSAVYARRVQERYDRYAAATRVARDRGARDDGTGGVGPTTRTAGDRHPAAGE